MLMYSRLRCIPSKLQMPMNAEVKNGRPEPDWLGAVRQQIESLRFGTVQVVVHEGRVVQIEKAEKIRLDNAQRTSSPHQSETFARS